MPTLSIDTETVGLNIDNTIATVRFQRPRQMNTFNQQMASDLIQVSEKLLNADELRVVHLCGEGPVFMAGGDIKHFAENLKQMPEGIVQTVRQLNAAVLNFSRLQIPILASAHGSAAGVGISFLALADLVIASDDCKFTMAYSNIGLPCDGGASYYLPRLLGPRKAAELLLLPDLFDAKTAQEIGLVNWVVPAQELNAHAQGLLKRLASGPSQAYTHIKNLLKHSAHSSLETQLENEAHAFASCTTTQDFATGVTAFLQKERAQFCGR